MCTLQILHGQSLPQVGDIIQHLQRKLRVVHVDMYTVIAVYI